jgi:hypothetical protein
MKTMTVAVALAAVLLAACGEKNRSDLPTVQKATWCPVGPRNSFDARQLLGKPEAQGRAGVEAGGCTMRVVSRDGVGLAVRQDWRPDRINVTIDDGVITSVRTDGPLRRR